MQNELEYNFTLFKQRKAIKEAADIESLKSVADDLLLQNYMLKQMLEAELKNSLGI
jgi:hypothetical protein